MKFYFILLAIIFHWRESLALEGERKEHQICFFSLNNSKEFSVAQDFFSKINQRSATHQFIVKEFFNPEEINSPKESFLNLINNNTPCDALIISGHHTGAFGGDRAEGTLDVSLLEDLSCKEEYEAWFDKVKAVWLQGCRTIGVEEITLQNHYSNEFDPQYHTYRVGSVLHEDGLEQTYEDLNREFSMTLDPDNTLSSRFQRIFPSGSIYGWSKTAPGKKSRSENSLIYHLAHLGNLFDNKKNAFLISSWANIYEKRLSSFNPFIEGFSELLSGNKEAAEKGKEAWIKHGHARYEDRQKGIPGFNNPHLNAYLPLKFNDDLTLRKAKKLDCKLREDVKKSGDLLSSVIDSILEDDKLISFNFNTLWEVLLNLKENSQKKEIYNNLRLKLKESENLLIFLNKKIRSKQLGLVKKIEYAKFMSDLKEFPLEADLYDILEKESLALIKKRYSRKRDYVFENLSDYKISLINSLEKHNFLKILENAISISLNDISESVKKTSIQVSLRQNFHPEVIQPMIEKELKYSLLEERYQTILRLGDSNFKFAAPFLKKTLENENAFQDEKLAALESLKNLGTESLDIFDEVLFSMNYSEELKDFAFYKLMDLGLQGKDIAIKYLEDKNCKQNEGLCRIFINSLDLDGRFEHLQKIENILTCQEKEDYYCFKVIAQVRKFPSPEGVSLLEKFRQKLNKKDQCSLLAESSLSMKTDNVDLLYQLIKTDHYYGKKDNSCSLFIMDKVSRENPLLAKSLFLKSIEHPVEEIHKNTLRYSTRLSENALEIFYKALYSHHSNLQKLAIEFAPILKSKSPLFLVNAIHLNNKSLYNIIKKSIQQSEQKIGTDLLWIDKILDDHLGEKRPEKRWPNINELLKKFGFKKNFH